MVKVTSALSVTMNVVRQFPPRESLSTEVIIELRYGMCERPLRELRSCSATITISR